MAKHQSPTAKAAAKVDPTVRSRSGVPEYPEGTHPPAPISEQTWNGERFSYSDLDEKYKPDPSTVAQTVEDPLEKDNEKARAESGS